MLPQFAAGECGDETCVGAEQHKQHRQTPGIAGYEFLDDGAAQAVFAVGHCGFQQAVVMLLLIVVGSLGIIVPVGVYFAMGDKAAPVLDGWKTWLAANNATVMIVLFVVFGVVLLGKGIGGL